MIRSIDVAKQNCGRQTQLLQDPICFTESIVTSAVSSRGLRPRLEPLFYLFATPDRVVFQMFDSALDFAFQIRRRVTENTWRHMLSRFWIKLTYVHALNLMKNWRQMTSPCQLVDKMAKDDNYEPK